MRSYRCMVDEKKTQGLPGGRRSEEERCTRGAEGPGNRAEEKHRKDLQENQKDNFLLRKQVEEQATTIDEVKAFYKNERFRRRRVSCRYSIAPWTPATAAGGGGWPRRMRSRRLSCGRRRDGVRTLIIHGNWEQLDHVIWNWKTARVVVLLFQYGVRFGRGGVG